MQRNDAIAALQKIDEEIPKKSFLGHFLGLCARSKEIFNLSIGRKSDFIEAVTILQNSHNIPINKRLFELRLIIRQGIAYFESNPLIETNSNIGISYINPDRISELNRIRNSKFDFTKLIKLCEEINFSFAKGCYLATGMLLRAILDHIPPIFGYESFAEIANNYGGSKSFKESMTILETSSRKISDSYLHTSIRKKENLPNATQINFSQGLDLLLQEVIRISKP